MNSPNDKYELVKIILGLVIGLVLIFGSLAIDLMIG